MRNVFLRLLEKSETSMPLWEELWVYFRDTYFTDETVYEHLNMGGGSLISIRNLIVGLFIGLSVAGFGAVFNKQVLGGFVRLLLKEECLSPEQGKTLPELDSADKLLIRYGVKRGVNLRRVVRCREEEEYNAETARLAEEHREKRQTDRSLPRRLKRPAFRVDPDRHHFYIPEEMKYTAEVKFEQKGNTWLGAIVMVLVMAVATVGVLLVLPQILSLVNELVGAITSGGNPDILT